MGYTALGCWFEVVGLFDLLGLFFRAQSSVDDRKNGPSECACEPMAALLANITSSETTVADSQKSSITLSTRRSIVLWLHIAVLWLPMNCHKLPCTPILGPTKKMDSTSVSEDFACS